MKKYVCLALVCFSLSFSCVEKSSDDSSPKSSTVLKKSGCAGSVLFSKGAKIEASTFSGNGKSLGAQITTVMAVDKQASGLQSTTTIQVFTAKGKEDKSYTSIYSCDGKSFSMDMRGMMEGNKDATVISTTGMAFPANLKVGDMLPDANQVTEMGNKKAKMKMIMNVKNRKVEAKEKLTNSSGSFDAYKITASVESTTEMDGMSEAMKNTMDAVRKKMGEQKIILWYSPEYAVLKMEMYTGKNLVVRTEVTKISK